MMKSNRLIKSSLRNEINSDLTTSFLKNDLENTLSCLNVPYRFENQILSENFNPLNNNEGVFKYNSERSQSIDISKLIICPSIFYLKSKTDLEKLQENNNFYLNSSHNQASFCTDYSKKPNLLPKRDGLNQYCVSNNKRVKSPSKLKKNSSFNKNEEIINKEIINDDKNEFYQKTFLSPQFFKAEAILTNNFQKQLISSSVMDNKYTFVPLCKPPLSPYSDVLHRSQGSMDGKKNKCFDHKTEDNSITDEKDISSNYIDVSIKENGEDDDEYENCYRAEEMDLLDNLDSEILNDDVEEQTEVDGNAENCESPTEEVLQEVHRLFLATSINDVKSPFIYSLFPNIPPVIRFVREGESVSPLPSHYKSQLKWRLSTLTPNVVKRAVKRSGFKLLTKGSQWIGYFGSHLKLLGFKSIQEHQKFNHLPGSFQIGRKDRLWRNVSILSSKNGKGKEFNFLPKTYCLPGDTKSLKLAWDDEDSAKKAKWILKPPASARGIGVKVINKWSQIPKKKPTIVQNYISRPFLIDGSKFDLRIYVAVTSCDPLRIYVHKNGLVRFASHKYSKSSKNISNRFIHLTNYSVNKKNENYTNNENHDKCQGHKWTLQTLWKHMEEDLLIDWRPIWQNIKDCIVKTIISVETNINSNIRMYCAQKNCVYELFGFDVLLDNKLKPWVIEVNVSPSLHSNSPLDIEVKSTMIADLFNLVGFQVFQTPEESVDPFVSQSRQTSFSISSQKYFKSAQRQPSLISLRKSASRNVSAGRGSYKSSLGTDNKTVKVHKNTQSNDSSSVLQPDNSNLNSNNVSESNFVKNRTSTSASPPIINNLEESNQNIIDLSLYQHRGVYSRTLTFNEKSKHIFYIQKDIYEDQSMLSTITDQLTIDDARILVESLDEFNRAGDFELVFPTNGEEMDKYITFVNSSGCRYYNILLYQFIKKYKTKSNTTKTSSKEDIYNLVRPEAIKELEQYSKRFMVNEDMALWSNPNSKNCTPKSRIKCRSSSAGNISSFK